VTSSFERIVSIILTVAAVATTATLVKRELFTTSQTGRRVAPPVSVAQWSTLLERAVRPSSTTARVTVLEFLDLECLGCKHYHRTVLNPLQEEFGDQVAFAYIHLPLKMHRFARGAAQAAECADQHGRFPAMLNAIFAKQDSIGLKPWPSYASEAGVTDSVSFAACLEAPAPARIDSGVAIAARLKVSATPTIVINGWQFPVPPTADDMTRFIRSLLAGEDPLRRETSR
jgi:protein-disulfide isomerase